MDQLLLRRRMLNMFRDEYIVFEDAEAERVCATNWGDGTHITKRQAASVTADQFKTAFVNNTTIVNFDEFKYFTGITAMQGNTSQWFSGCTALKKISLPNKLVTLNNNNVTGGIFKNCLSLEEVTFPETLTRIGNYTFYHSTANPFSANMTKVNVPSVEFYARLVFRNQGASPFYNSSASTRGIYVNGVLVTHIIVPEGVTTLTGGFLYKNNTVTEITIPTTLTSTSAYSFSGASTVSRINISDFEKYLRISWNNNTGYPFAGNSNGGELYLNGQKVTSVTIPSTITEVKMHAFHRVRGITSLTLHNNITNIGINAFTDGEFTTVTLPSSLTTIGDQAFSYCHNLTSFTIPASVTSCGDNVLINCESVVDFYDYSSVCKTGNAVRSGARTGAGTGTFYADNDFNNNVSTGGVAYFKKYIFNGNYTANWNAAFGFTDNTLGTTMEEFRVKGNFDASATTANNYYVIVQPNHRGPNNLKFIEILGSVTATRPFGPGNAYGLGNDCIIHLGYNGVATTTDVACAWYNGITKIYVGDGSSQAADQAVLDQYLADTNWAQYASKLDLWYNYNGTYKTS